MQENHKLTVLISIYNNADTLGRCFESIQNQTFKDFFVVCIDDGSTDGSLNIEKKWQETFGKENFLLLENKSNIGLTKSLNKGLGFIETEYIARIDADDFWEKEKLEKQIAFLENNPDHGIVGCNHLNIYGNNKKQIKFPETNEQISKKLFRKNPFAHSCILAKTDLIKNAGGYDEKIKYGQDYELWLRCFPLTKFYNIQEVLCSRNIDSGISVDRQDAQMWQSIKTRAKYIGKLGYSWKNYAYLLEPFIVILTPSLMKKIKRKYL